MISNLPIKITPTRILIVACLAVHLFVVSSILIQRRESVIMPLFNDTMFRVGPGADFFALYNAGNNVKHGITPYSQHKDPKTPFGYNYRYLPALAYLGVAFSWLSPDVAYGLWTVLIEVALFGFIYLLYKKKKNERFFLLSCICLLLGSPVFLEIHMGQFTLISTVLCVVAFMLQRRAARQTAFGLSVFLKPFTIITLPALLRDRKTWALIFSAFVALMLSFPFFLLNPGQWSYFYDTNVDAYGKFGVGNFSIMQLIFLVALQLQFQRLLEAWILFTMIFRNTTLAIALIISLFSRANQMLLVMLLLLAHFFSYSHVWEHHMTGILIICAYILCMLDNPKWYERCVGLSMVLSALPTLFYFFHTYLPTIDPDPFLGWPLYALYLLMLPKVLSVALLFISTLIRCCKSGWCNPLTGLITPQSAH